MDNEVNLVCVGTATSHLDSHCGIGSGSGNNSNNSSSSNNLSKSQLKMREQALRKRVSANTSTQSTTYKAPIFGIPVKIEPSDSDRTQKLIKQALGDYDDFKPVIEKMFICPVPPGTPKPKSAGNNQVPPVAPAHNFHHAGGKRKRSRSLEEVDISQLIKESFALPPLLSRILNVDIVKQEHQNSSVNSSNFSNSSSVLIKTEPDQNSIPNCDKLLPSGRKHPETPNSLPPSSKVASKSATAESTKLPAVLEGISVKKEERGSLSPDTAPGSTNNWSLSSFLDPVAAPACQIPAPSFPSQPSDKKDNMTMSKRETQQPHHKLLMADIDSSFSLAVSGDSKDSLGITTTTAAAAAPLKKKQRKNITSLEHQAQQLQQQPPSSPQSKSPATARLPKTYRLLARKKTPPTTPPPSLPDLAPKREFIGEESSMDEKGDIPLPPSCKQSSRSANYQGTIAQTTTHQTQAPPSSVIKLSPTHSAPSCSSSNSSGSEMEDGEAEAIARKSEVTEKTTITSLPVKIDLALIKKIPILPYHYNNDINYASSCSSSTASSLLLLQSTNPCMNALGGNSANSNMINNNNNGDGTGLRMGEGGLSASFASSNTANAWAPLLPPPHNPLTRWDLGDNRQMLPPPPMDMGATVERLPAQLSRFEHFSPYQYKPLTLSSSDQSLLFSNKDHPCNNNSNQLKSNEAQTQPQTPFPPKISWGLPSQLPCVYSLTRRLDIPFWHNIGLCPELTTYPCNDIIRIAKNLKRSADREVTRNLKVMMYLDAVLYFFLNGDYMQNKKFDLTGAHKIYHDTMNVCRHISDLVQKEINSNVSDNTVMDQIFVILTQKIQALLYIKMFQCKKEQCLRNQRLLNQEFPKLFSPAPTAFFLGINSSQNYSYTQVDGSTNLLNHHSSSPDPSPVSSVGSATNYGETGVKTNLSDTDPKSMNRLIHPTVHQQLTMLEGALISHHLWDLSENGISTLTSPPELSSTSSYPRHLISSNPHPNYRDCFTEILTVCRQPLTLNSSVWHLVIYVKFALYYLGYWLNPTYYDPQTTIPSVNASAPPPSSNGLKDFHKKNRPPPTHKEVAINGKS